MVRSVRKDGYLTEQAAAMLLNFRPDVARFISEARLEDRKQPRIEVDHRYVISDGRLRELPMKMGPLLMSDIWSMRAKLRMMLEPLARRSRGGEESVSEFVRRRLGGEVLDKALGPYVAGLLASDPDRASAAAVLPRLVALERRWGSIVLGAVVHRLLRRRSAVQTEAFSFQGGMATLAGALAEANGVCFCGGHEAVSLLPTGNGWLATARTCTGEREVRASQVILSTPASTTAGLVRSTQTELASLLDTIEYAPLNVVHTGFHRHGIRHALDGNGFLSLGDAGAPLIGCMWMSMSVAPVIPTPRRGAIADSWTRCSRHCDRSLGSGQSRRWSGWTGTVALCRCITITTASGSGESGSSPRRCPGCISSLITSAESPCGIASLVQCRRWTRYWRLSAGHQPQSYVAMGM
jgi:oxygen-dependent protoporphyrinogen oxidase